LGKSGKKKLKGAGHKVHEEYPIGSGETIDLVIIGKNRKIDVEVETGKSDTIHNIRKCLDMGFEVISVATSKTAMENFKLKLGCFSKDKLTRVRIRKF
jgi:hypothetical protein